MIQFRVVGRVGFATLLRSLRVVLAYGIFAASAGCGSGDNDGPLNRENVNFILLERIVEKVSGTDIRNLLTTDVYQPLGLRTTAYPTDSQMPGLLRGYGRKSEAEPLEDRTEVNPIPAGGAGAMISDLQDLRLYTRALCRGDLLKAGTQAQRLQPTRLENEPELVGYGEGLARLGRFCGHNGTIFGFSTEVWYLSEAEATFVVSVNRLDLDDKSKSFNTFARVSRLLFPTLVSS
jgi:D-alanyl-D-alanine carboxypeptidase